MNTQIIKHLSDNDEVLKNIIQTIPSPEIISTQDVFHDLMSCVIEQQIHYRSTKKTFQKALEASNLQLLTLDNFSELEEKGLKQVKMSMNKYETLERVLTFFNENKLNWSEVSDENIRKILSNQRYRRMDDRHDFTLYFTTT